MGLLIYLVGVSAAFCTMFLINKFSKNRFLHTDLYHALGLSLFSWVILVVHFGYFIGYSETMLNFVNYCKKVFEAKN